MPVEAGEVGDLVAGEGGADQRPRVLPGGAVGYEDAAGDEGGKEGEAVGEAEVGELRRQERFDVFGRDGHDQVDVEEREFPDVA